MKTNQVGDYTSHNHSNQKLEQVTRYWELSSAYRGRPNNLGALTIGGLIVESRDLAGVAQYNWGRLENHSAELHYNAVMHGSKAPKSKKPACSVTTLIGWQLKTLAEKLGTQAINQQIVATQVSQ